jgi:transcriptional regulator with XRE-family HTH domain
MDLSYKTPLELQAFLGERLRALRVDRGLTQAEAASRAGVSLRALQKLEAGSGSELETFLRILKAVGDIAVLDLLAPAPSVSPMALLAASEKNVARKRVRHSAKLRL